MKSICTFLFVCLISFSVFAQSDLLAVNVEGVQGENQIDVILTIENLTDTYVKVPKGDVKYVLEYTKDDSVQTKATQFSFGEDILLPREKITKEKYHMDVFISGGKFLSLKSFISELAPKKLDAKAIKADLKTNGFISVTKEGTEVDMKELGKITFLIDDDKLVATHVNASKQSRKFTVTYNYFDLSKEGYKVSASASSNILVKVKPGESTRLSSIELGSMKYALIEAEYLVQPLLFKSIKKTNKGDYFSFQNGDYGTYTQAFAKDPVFVSDIDGSSSDAKDFLNRAVE